MTLTYKVTLQGYSVSLCCIEFLDPKNHGNKKKFVAVACLQLEIGTDVGNVVTTWRHVKYMQLHATIITSLVGESRIGTTLIQAFGS